MIRAGTDRPDLMVFPPALGGGSLALALLLEWLLPLGLLPPPFQIDTVLIGLGLCGLAGWLAISAERRFKAAGTNVSPRRPARALATDGPYRFTRNPMYLGMVLLLAGLGFLFSLDWSLLFALPVWAILHVGVVLREEAYLTEKFGDAYRALLARVPRWF